MLKPFPSWCVLSLLVASCAGAPQATTTERASDAETGLRLGPEEIAALDDDLRASLSHDAHHYLRYVAARFVGIECQIADEGPTVNLQGDAHLEQYLVTTLGRGLGDFDEATTGPVSIDLVRLATSVRVASRMRSWDAERLWSRFLEGYLAALEDPSLSAPEPPFARVIREHFTGDHAALLSWCDSLFMALDVEESARVEVALGRYVEMLIRHHPETQPEWFDVVTIGSHNLGIGSRRASNYLIRTRGPTEDPADDLIVEAKEVTRNPLADCLPIARRVDPLRILVADARLAYVPFQDVGFVEIDGRPYWIHEWLDDYVELDVSAESLTEQAIAEVLYDVGVQLGHGHPRGLGDPYEEELRRDLVHFLGTRAGALWAVSGRLATAVWSAWEAFRRAG